VAVSVFADIKDLEDRLDAADADARDLVAGLTEPQGAWRAAPGSWSVAECLDHLATGNRVYLRAMVEPAARARRDGRLRRRPARPGLVGRWFVRILEPPVKPRFKSKAPRIIEPRTSPSLADAYASFTASQADVQAFLRANADLDLARVRFPNPLVPGVRFSLATGLHVIVAHERRHLWQAWRVREGAEQSAH
jgi:DinB superfamily